ncbi:hypothetical protein ZYGR_0AD02590 [Zygosaccharomyces rouxii]|uniref:Dihydrolipoamide dehydrogenase-binding protein of pyruvate dehydrogenase complex n=2 Tax=Zygosaccharomyces rouxii TaxID=4956 RepID=C5E0E2_ZYGRC|nr:uncharacterized protein ZYRO0G11968g [Zygosaccharomyces rouxii]KAH9202569.1 hypothetical protein LQ764DRAFT_26851 [Zygosaccharomyces rouxii]GAV51076.1 hypothetical protein ZYGR_0AD02590 [Zygosaccharomyces rouxii]CAR29576.1 ZYRO0G11968p [Zygosaccharomyces rouxii]
MLRSTFIRSSKALFAGQLRRFHVSNQLLDAQPYKMPAVSPTMDKGNLVEWKVKVGDEINAGDVLLEVESDKAQVDVECQDDVKLAKILVDNGTKDVPVGQVIAWLADVDDDLSSLEIPDVAPEAGAQPKKQASSKPQAEEKKPSEPKKSASTKPSGILNAANPDQTLLPSVHTLLVGNGISKEDALKNIKASGSNGRLLKGDVLAHLGKISEDSVVKVAEYIKSGEKLDLSNIELREASKAEATEAKQSQDGGKAEAPAPKPAKPEPVVIRDQLTVQVPAGVSLEQYKSSLRAFVDSAFHIAHEQPVANTHSQYYDDIFESLITPAPKKPRFSVSYDLVSESPISQRQNNDIFDFLAGRVQKVTPESPIDGGNYIFQFQVKVDDKLFDAKDKAQKFVKSLKELKIQ